MLGELGVNFKLGQLKLWKDLNLLNFLFVIII